MIDDINNPIEINSIFVEKFMDKLWSDISKLLDFSSIIFLHLLFIINSADWYELSQ